MNPPPASKRGSNIIGYAMMILYSIDVGSDQKRSESEAGRRYNPMRRRLTKGTGRQSEKCKTAEMLERGGGLHEDSEVHERRDRSGKENF